MNNKINRQQNDIILQNNSFSIGGKIQICDNKKLKHINYIIKRPKSQIKVS